MNTEVKPAADAESTSREDKFFGLKTSIEDMVPDDDDVIIDEADKETAKEPAEKGATDEDIGDYSKKVQKRFDKLTWEKKEEERQKQAVIAERDEAYRVAKALHHQSQQQAQIISTGEARLVEQIKDRARMAVEAARGKYRKAFEDGNTDEIVSAQEDLIKAQSENKAALDYDAEYRQRVSNWAAQQQQRQKQQAWQAQQPKPQPPQQPTVQQPTRAATTWATNNPWFGKNEHRDMTAIAYATHETMIRDKGIAPDSDEYFEELDATMKMRFPEYFEAEEGHSSHSVSRPNVVVAPATRSGANTRKVTLNASQRSLAKVLGISESDYAKQLLKEQKRG